MYGTTPVDINGSMYLYPTTGTAHTHTKKHTHTHTPSILTTGSGKKIPQNLLTSLVRVTGTTGTGGTDWLRHAALRGGAGGGTGGTWATSWGWVMYSTFSISSWWFKMGIFPFLEVKIKTYLTPPPRS